LALFARSISAKNQARGKLRGVKGPGLFLIIPVIDNVVAVIDERIQTTAFSAEETLTKDTVQWTPSSSGSSMTHRRRPRPRRSMQPDRCR
jgi:SPFH domain / Band 7 family